MSFTDETLMAYADGELDAETRAAIEAAMATDAQLARRIARHRELREALRGAYADVLQEPVPERLLAAARTAPTSGAGSVVGIERARRRAAPARWSWPQWGAMAASLLLGVILGRAGLLSPASVPLRAQGGALLAEGPLAAALTEQLASAPSPADPVEIGLSFRAKSGAYCRTFALREGTGFAGLACREADAWHVRVLAQGEAAAGGDAYRMAGAALPPAVMQAVEEQIAGEPLDAEAEAAARRRGWSE